MNEIQPRWLDPNESNYIGEGQFDLAQVLQYQNGRATFALNIKARSLVVEIDIDGNGNSTGGVALYLGEATGSLYWRNVRAGQMRIMQLPATKVITLVPFAGSQGLLKIQMSKEPLPPAVFSLV